MRRASGLGVVDEKAEAQVVAHERGDVGAQALAGAQAREDRARQLGAAGVMVEERDAARRARGDDSRVSGLAASCSRAPQRSASPRVSSSASGSASNCCDAAQRVRRRRATAAGSACKAIVLLEHLERVTVDVAG